MRGYLDNVMLGRGWVAQSMGWRGGKAQAKALSARQRTEIAKKTAEKRRSQS